MSDTGNLSVPEVLPGREYQHLLRRPRWFWWRAGLALSLSVVLWLIGMFVLVLAAAAVSVSTGQGLDLLAMTSIDDLSPGSFLVMNLAIALLIPAALLATRMAHGPGAGRISSVVGHLRWGWMLQCMSLLAPLYLLVVGLDLWLDPPDDGRHEDWLPLLLIILLTTPFQAAGEEYFARGLILQNVGGLFADPRRGVLIASTISVLLFAAAHGSADPWIFLDLAIFGGACALLAVRTGGLEAPIALHAINNMVGMILTLLFGGWAEGFVDENAVGHPVDPATALLICGLACWLLLRMADRQGVLRVRPATAAIPSRASVAA